MAKNTKRTKRMNQSDHNVNRAMLLLTVGILAEFYLLMVNNYFVKGGVNTVLAMMTVLKVISYIGCALVGAGLVFWFTRRSRPRCAPAAPWLLSAGVFFAVSSRLMLTVYPQGTKILCVLVPVAMLLGIIFLLYPREFSVQALALTAALMAMYLIHRSGGSTEWNGFVTGCCIFAVCAVLALIIAVWKAQRSDGRLEKLGGLRIVSSGADYKLIYAVLAVCAVVIAAALFAAAIAYYALWALAIGTFLLAVYYTVKMM